MATDNEKQIPVRIYRREHLFVIAAPLAGMEPENINIRIAGKRVTIEARRTVPAGDDLELLKDEWTIGPCHREIVLPQNVDGSLANATYGNGVLVLTLPKAAASTGNGPVEFKLTTVGLARGEHVGHMGHHIRPTTMRAHQDRLWETPRGRAV
jgi:HSP20 family protein